MYLFSLARVAIKHPEWAASRLITSALEPGGQSDHREEMERNVILGNEFRDK